MSGVRRDILVTIEIQGYVLVPQFKCCHEIWVS
jgi:hypothetical protein